ncbi:MAG: AI-2E family transporter [Candidatus Saccharimonadales bacterium]|jgi:predicted PurR-regulated permease PerM
MFGFLHKKSDKEVSVTITNRTIIRVILLVAIAFILFIFLRKASHAIFIIFTAFFLALALNSPVHWLAEQIPGKRKGSRTLATSISFLIIVIILGAFCADVIPNLARHTTAFIKDLPHIAQEARNKQTNLGKFINHYHLQASINNYSNQLSSHLHNITGTVVSTISSVASSFFTILAIIVLTFMMLVEGPYWLNRVNLLIPEEHRKHGNKLAQDMYAVIRGYVNGQVLLAAITSILIAPALFILHISNPIALIVVIFLTSLIPLIGHMIGVTIVTIVALFHSPWAALIIFAYFVLYMQIENYVIQPKIQANSTNLSPLLVFAAVVIGVCFGGLFGGLVAIPVMGCLRVLVVDYLHNHGKLVTEDPTKEPDVVD